MIIVGVPSTTANVGPGFDSIGIALNLYNIFKCQLSDRDKIEVFGYGKETLSKTESNLVIRAMDKVYNYIGKERPSIHLIQENNIPTARGLGSSASAIVGGILLANHLLGNILDKDIIIKIAMEMEGHPDNVVPAIMGQGVISWMEGKDHFIKQFPIKDDLKFIACIPEVEIKTADFRNLLPLEIDREDAVYNISRAGLLIHALITGDYSSLEIAVEDRLHQPYRIDKIPGAKDAMKYAKKSGALGVFLSGSGPTIMAMATEKTEEIGQAMVNGFNNYNIKSNYIVLSTAQSILPTV